MRVWVADHKSAIGAALVRHLCAVGYENILTCAYTDKNLGSENCVAAFIEINKPDYTFFPAAYVWHGLGIDGVMYYGFDSELMHSDEIAKSCVQAMECAKNGTFNQGIQL